MLRKNTKTPIPANQTFTTWLCARRGIEDNPDHECAFVEVNETTYPTLFRSGNNMDYLSMTGEFMNLLIVYKDKYWAIAHRRSNTIISTLISLMKNRHMHNLAKGNGKQNYNGTWGTRFTTNMYCKLPVVDNFLSRILNVNESSHHFITKEYDPNDLKFYIIVPHANGKPIINAVWHHACEYVMSSTSLKAIEQIQFIQRYFLFENSYNKQIVTQQDVNDAKDLPFLGVRPPHHATRVSLTRMSLMTTDLEPYFFESPGSRGVYRRFSGRAVPIGTKASGLGIYPKEPVTTTVVTAKLTHKLLSDVKRHWDETIAKHLANKYSITVPELFNKRPSARKSRKLEREGGK